MEFRMAIQVKDNFLPQTEFDSLQKIILSDDFPWFYQDLITDDDDPKRYYYLTHGVYKEPGMASNFFYLFENFLKLIKSNSIIRIKANLYPSSKIKRRHRFHQDFLFKHKACILYINDNNGETCFKQKNGTIKKVLPKPNRVVFFNGHEPHCSSTCTNSKRRVNVNFNYI